MERPPSSESESGESRPDLAPLTTDAAQSRPAISPTHSSDSTSSGTSAQPLYSASSSPQHAFPPSAPASLPGQDRAGPRPMTSTPYTSDKRGVDIRAVAWLYDYDGGPEDDDWLHLDGVERPRGCLARTCGCFHISLRGCLNVGVLLMLGGGLLMLFAGFPILRIFLWSNEDVKAASFFGLGGTNGSGQVPMLPGLFSLIDAETPSEAQSWSNPLDKSPYHLVFSDEFNQEGRTFWPGDDPFWEAVDLHYHVTGDYEWYSPEALNTSNGFLNIWLQQTETHNLNFQSGMLQSWNKFCFQGGYLETSVILPGAHDMQGYWPAVWMLGNLGRAGYAGTTQGMWPYSYSECDVGTLANQTYANKTGPESALHAYGLYGRGQSISFLEGQRASACTCAGEDHPGPSVTVGRSAPEIDLFETQSYNQHGMASQSFQIAPFDANYTWDQTRPHAILYPGSSYNSYTGGRYQEAVSGLGPVPDSAYALSGARPVKMGVQYDPDWTNDGSGSITWFIDGKPTWTVHGTALGPNAHTKVGQRKIPTEPMSIVINLALSDGFQQVKWDQLAWPAVMKLDYVRVYQRDGQEDRITCDPADHPTARYIQDHMDVYGNANLTTWPQERYSWPKNSLIHQC